ncbi:MAG: hypothetical protein B7Z19_04020 [Polynucleobacter sp. 32-46-5]|nr:MAG: hypothetical protein B7Z19_04020 [Polynucleobacter sp. 32-46-5]
MIGILCYWYFVVVTIADKPITDTLLSPEVRTDGPVDKAWFSRKLDVTERKDTRLPLTIITGFLGSGKTTLVKNILQNTVGMKVLVVENEIGAEGIDHELLMQHTAKEEIILMNNGCVCCTGKNCIHCAFFDILEACLNLFLSRHSLGAIIHCCYTDNRCSTYSIYFYLMYSQCARIF